MSFERLARLDGQTITVRFAPDADGYIGRECPADECGRYFKIAPGTGLPIDTCGCPYCGHRAGQRDFATRSQQEYAKSVVMRAVTEATLLDMREAFDRDLGRPGDLIRLSMRVEGEPSPLKWYSERDLETSMVCDGCSLRYAVYGVFASCPDCERHNSLSILRANLDLVGRFLSLQEKQDGRLAERLLEQALGQAVADFDGFGRALAEANRDRARDPAGIPRLSFQNIEGARRNVETIFGVRLGDGVDDEAWTALVRAFQKRHLFAHRAGVVDEEYVRRARDPHAVLGHKVTLAVDEVRGTLGTLLLVSIALHGAVTALAART